MDFEIVYHDGCFKVAHSSLAADHEKYLNDYLEKASRYKVIGSHLGSPVISLYQSPLATQAGRRSLEFRLKRRFKNLRLPATATMAVNKACQCDCTHCSAVFYNKSVKKELSDEELLRAMNEAVEMSVTQLILLGGEPLLKKSLPKIIGQVPPDKATVILFTNGEFLTPEKCRELKNCGLMGAFVSLDSSDGRLHDQWRRRQGLFAKALKGLENLKNAGLVAGISSHLSAQNMKEDAFESMMDLGKKTGVDEITFFDAIPSGQWLKETSCLLSPSDRMEISKLVRQYRKLDDYPGLSVQSTMTSDCGSAFCFAANTQFYLTAFGEMCPCDFTPLTIGTYPNESIQTLWEKMISTEPYNNRAKSCRMQNAEFRKEFIEKIPEQGPYPYPLHARIETS